MQSLRNPRTLLQLIFALTIYSLSNPAFANKQIWAEYGWQSGSEDLGVNLQVKMVQQNRGWTFRYESKIHTIITSIKDRETGQQHDPVLETTSLLKTWSRSGQRWHTDVGIGIGYTYGSWADQCVTEPVTTGFFDSRDCNVFNVNEFGIPIQASAAFGKYIGIGIAANFFISPAIQHASLSVFIPLGVFPGKEVNNSALSIRNHRNNADTFRALW